MNYEPFLRDLAAEGWSLETVKAYRTDLRKFADYLSTCGVSFEAVTHRVINDYVASMREQKLSQATIRRRVAAISSYIEYLRSMGERIANPTRNRLRRKRTERRIDHTGKAVNESVLHQLIEGPSSARDRALILLFLTSGLRLSEVYQLDIDSIQEVTKPDSDGKPAVIGGTGRVIGKGSKERRFYFDAATAAAIALYVSQRSDSNPALFLSERKQRMSKRAIQYTLEALCRRLGLPHIHPHQLRHTFATRLANARIQSRVLQELMGHAKFDTTTKYFRLKEQTKARDYYAAMELLALPEN